MITPAIKHQVTSLFPPGDVSDAPEDLLAYSFDATGMETAPELVAFATSAEQVSELLKLANTHRFPVTARGAGTGFTGASIPARRGVALVMAKMNRILEIDPDNLTALVEPGVVNNDLQRTVERLGFFYPPDPASLKVSTIGGNVATGAGGPRAVKYGVTKDYVLSLEAVLPTGEIIHTGANTVKSAVGYDLTRLLVGSEGTLGVLTKIRLRLLPKPESTQTALAAFKSVDDAARAVSAVIRAKIIPSALEFMDGRAARAVGDFLGGGVPPEAQALLLVETDGSAAAAAHDMARARQVMAAFMPVSMTTACDETEREELWRVRRSLSQAVRRLRPTKINEDVTVPRSRIPELIRRLEELSARTGLPIVNFGHAGDGNIHVNIMTDKSDPEEYQRALAAVDEVFDITLSLGGTLSGEHGVGMTKAKYIEMELGAAGVTLTRKIKSVFDPNNILNPGKITPQEET